jgi:flagellar basal-body rod protein FlgC
MRIDSGFGTIDIAISGLSAQDKNMAIISSNVANAQTTDNGSGKPYRRIEAVFKTDGADGIGGVTVNDFSEDQSDFQQILKPGHPNADKDGYVSMPNVNLPTEMMNLAMATKAYQANAAVLKRYQSMAETTLELLK